MPYAGIAYPVQKGFAEQIAEIFSPEQFTRVDSPFLLDEHGEEIGCLVCTGLFLHRGLIVRVIQHQGGTVEDVRRHMSHQEGVREAERRLATYLTQPRDTATPEGFAAHFDRSLMTVLSSWQDDDEPAAGLIALCHPIRPTPIEELAALSTAALSAAPVPDADSPIRGSLLLAGETAVVRVYRHDHGAGEQLRDHLRGLAVDDAVDTWLAALRPSGAPRPRTVAEYLQLDEMTCISHLSAAVTG